MSLALRLVTLAVRLAQCWRIFFKKMFKATKHNYSAEKLSLRINEYVRINLINSFERMTLYVDENEEGEFIFRDDILNVGYYSSELAILDFIFENFEYDGIDEAVHSGHNGYRYSNYAYWQIPKVILEIAERDDCLTLEEIMDLLEFN